MKFKWYIFHIKFHFIFILNIICSYIKFLHLIFFLYFWIDFITKLLVGSISHVVTPTNSMRTKITLTWRRQHITRSYYYTKRHPKNKHIIYSLWASPMNSNINLKTLLGPHGPLHIDSKQWSHISFGESVLINCLPLDFLICKHGQRK